MPVNEAARLEPEAPTYEELRARLPECARPSFDQMVDAGKSIAECAEAVRLYREFHDDIPDEANEGFARLLAAGEKLEGLPEEEASRLSENLIVKRAGDFTAARHRQFMWQVHSARMRVRRQAAAPAPAVCPTPILAAPRERRDSSSSRTSGQDPGGDDDPDPPGDCLELVLVDEQTPATQTPPRYCRCERDRPFTAPNWDIGPDGGDCRSCTLELRPRDVRYMHAIARSERARLEGKGWSL